jgi:hypothetical protein
MRHEYTQTQLSLSLFLSLPQESLRLLLTLARV